MLQSSLITAKCIPNISLTHFVYFLCLTIPKHRIEAEAQVNYPVQVAFLQKREFTEWQGLSIDYRAIMQQMTHYCPWFGCLEPRLILKYVDASVRISDYLIWCQFQIIHNIKTSIPLRMRDYGLTGLGGRIFYCFGSCSGFQRCKTTGQITHSHGGCIQPHMCLVLKFTQMLTLHLGYALSLILITPDCLYKNEKSIFKNKSWHISPLSVAV